MLDINFYDYQSRQEKKQKTSVGQTLALGGRA